MKKWEKFRIFAGVKFAGFFLSLFFYINSCHLIFVWAKTVTNIKLIFFNKEKINKKRNLLFQRRQCILEFTLIVFCCPRGFFVYVCMVKFCLKHEFILLLEIRLLTDNTFDSSRQEWEKIKKKVFFFSPKRKNIISVIIVSFLFFTPMVSTWWGFPSWKVKISEEQFWSLFEIRRSTCTLHLSSLM